jgi:hypothetical protein
LEQTRVLLVGSLLVVSFFCSHGYRTVGREREDYYSTWALASSRSMRLVQRRRRIMARYVFMGPGLGVVMLEVESLDESVDCRFDEV